MSRDKFAFQKPDVPDFIKRIQDGQQKEIDRRERPMTEAPMQEDELPAIADDINHTDLQSIREQYGLQAVSDTKDGMLARKQQSDQPIKVDKLAGLGSKGLKKRNAKVIKSDIEHEKVDEEHMSSKSKSAERAPLKSKVKRRKVLSFE